MVGDRRIELRWRAFTEPAAPRASPERLRAGRTRHAIGQGVLSHETSPIVELAACTGIKPVSLHGQWSCLVRCIADLADPLQTWRTGLDSNQRGAVARPLRGGCRRSLGYWSGI